MLEGYHNDPVKSEALNSLSYKYNNAPAVFQHGCVAFLKPFYTELLHQRN